MQAGKLRRTVVMIVGLMILALGVALFKISMQGNDPSTALVMAIGDVIHVNFAYVLWAVNLLFFCVEFVFGRRYIGAGTFGNWFLIGPTANLWISLLERFLKPVTPAEYIGVMAVAVLVVGLGASMYQEADLGIAPYDALAICLTDRLPIPYFWCRIFVDASASLIAYLLGGIVGLGTLCCALGLGPFITMFNKLVSDPLVGRKPGSRTDAA